MIASAEVVFRALPQIIRSKDPHALKIPARRAEYSLTESAFSPFQAEPGQVIEEKRHRDYTAATAIRNL